MHQQQTVKTGRKIILRLRTFYIFSAFSKGSYFDCYVKILVTLLTFNPFGMANYADLYC
jgi:hypothetical protein